MNESLQDWLISHYGPEQMNPGLERISRVLGPLLKKFENTKIIIIAGTNGKGETTLWLSRLLKNETHFVWTSPHIERITERFRSHDGEIELCELQALAEDCHRTVQSQNQALSFYEFLFFVFCSWAAKNPPEYLLLEVGLGGRLDAVNVFDANLVLLPSISRDHQEILGKRYDQILGEKLGTLRAGTILLSFVHLQYLREKVAQISAKCGSKVIDLESFHLAKPYEFSKRNQILAYAAYAVLKNLPFEPSSWPISEEGMEYRGEFLKNKSEWIFYGSHNPDGMRKLIQFLQLGNYTFARPPFDFVIVAFSARNSKDLTVMLKMLKVSGLGKIIVTTFAHPKAAPAQLVKDLCVQEGLKFVEDHINRAKDWNGHRVLITGSYYFLGHVKYTLGS